MQLREEATCYPSSLDLIKCKPDCELIGVKGGARAPPGPLTNFLCSSQPVSVSAEDMADDTASNGCSVAAIGTAFLAYGLQSLELIASCNYYAKVDQTRAKASKLQRA